MDNLSRLQQIEQQFDQLVEAGAYAEALDLATREAHVFPDYSQRVVFMWRITMACRLEDAELALQLLGEAVAAGHWYHGLAEDPDFRLLLGRPEFERLVAVCEERRVRAMASAVPALKLLQPECRCAPYPLLVALHGAQSSAEAFASHWAAAAAQGWLVAVPQSSQAYGPGTYSWNDWEWALAEVERRYAALRTGHDIDPRRVVLAGFSQGGGLAAWLALGGAIEARGLVLVGPFLADVESVVPLLEARRPRGLRAFIAAGERDRYCYGVAQRLAALLPQYGVACRLETYPGLEHGFPQDFESRLPHALEYVLED